MALKFLNDGYFAGKVGIGTQSPDFLLEISSATSTDFIKLKSASSSASPIKFIFEKSSGEQGIIEYNRNGDLEIYNTDGDGGVMIDGSASAGSDFYVANSGNIGIGTNTPNAKLDIQGTQGQLFSVTDNLSGEIFAVADISGVPIMTVNSSGVSYFDGNVGIGTASPSRNLQVKGTANTAIAITAPTTGLAQLALGDTNDDNYAQILLDNSSSKLQIQNGGGGIISNRGITLDSSENVGVGTDSPVARFHVNAGTSNTVGYFESTDSRSRIVLKDNSGEVHLNAIGDNIAFGTSASGSERMRITSAGNVGIGTTSPVGKLYVGPTWTLTGGNDLYIKNQVTTTSYDPSVNNTQDLGITYNTSSTTTTGPDKVGLVLHNDAGVAGQFSPMIIFSGREATPTQFKAAMAGIYARSPLGTGNANDYIDGELIFATAGAATKGIVQRMVINKEGNVGIGTTNPTVKLHIDNGGAATTAVRIDAGAIAGSIVAYGNNGNKYFELGEVGGSDPGRLSLFESGVSKIQLATNAVSYFNGGNVGIGDTTPLSKLEVAGSIKSTNYDTSHTSESGVTLGYNATEAMAYLETWTSKPLTIRTYNYQAFNISGSEAMRIDTTRNVGIGTTSPRVKLHVNGTNASVGTIGTPKNDWYTTAYNGIQVGDGTTLWGRAGDSHFSGNYYVKNNSGAAQDTYINSLPANDFWLDNGSGSLKYRNAVSGTAGNAITFNTRFVVLNNGNFGIGTTNPTDKLNINTGAGTFDFKDYNLTYNTSLAVRSESGYLGLVTEGAQDVFISTNGFANKRIVVKSDGKVGIGTASPTAGLHVVGTGLFTGLVSGITPVAADNFVTKAYVDGSGGGTGPFLPLAGGTMTGTAGVLMPDNFRLKFGDATTPDLQIFHNATDSFIINEVGDFYISNQADNKDIVFTNDNGSGGTATYFFLDGSKADGTGNLYTNFPDKSRLTFGDKPNGDLQIYHDGINSYITDEGTGILNIRSSNKIKLRTQANEDYLIATEGGSVELYYDNIKKLETTSTGVAVTGAGIFTGNLNVNGNATLGDATTDDHVFNGQVTHVTADALGYKLLRSNGSTSMLISATGDSEIEFGTDNGSGTNTTQWTIGKDSTDNSFRISNSASLGTSDTLTLAGANATFAGNVGVAGKTPTHGLTLAQGTGVGNKIVWSDSTPDFAASIYASNSTDKLTFATKNASNVETTALEIDTSQNATFAGDVKADTHFTSSDNQLKLSTNSDGTVFLRPDGKSSITAQSKFTTSLATIGTSIAITGAATATTATTSTDNNATLTTKGYVDGLVTGVPVYRGTWDARNNTERGSGSDGGDPDLRLAANKILGNYYIVETAGSATPNGANTKPDSWNVGDWCIFSDVTSGAGTDLWQKIDNTSVISGAGTGQSVTKWEGTSGATSETLTDGPITFSTNDSTFAGNVSLITGKQLIFDGGTDATYISEDIADRLRFFVGGAEFMRFTEDTTDMVNFFKDVTVSGDIEIDNASGDPFLKLKTSAQQYVLRIDQSDSEKFQIRNTTSSVTALSIDTSSNATFAGNVSLGGSTTSYLESRYNASSQFSSRLAFNGLQLGNNGENRIIAGRTSAGSPLAFYVNNTNDGLQNTPDGVLAMKIIANGNVGIGTTTPNNKLTIASGSGGGTPPDSRTQLYVDKNGEAYISINSPAGSFNGLRLNAAGVVKGFVELYDNTSQGKKLSIGTVDARDVVFNTTNTEKMRITAAGNVGIGTTTPGEKLEVNGNIKIKDALLSNQENLDIDTTSAETIAQVATASYTAAFFDFVVNNSALTSVRSGTVYACHDLTNVEFTETSTQDIGDTSDVVLSVDISGGQMRLRATVASDNWSVKTLIRAI